MIKMNCVLTPACALFVVACAGDGGSTGGVTDKKPAPDTYAAGDATNVGETDGDTLQDETPKPACTTTCDDGIACTDDLLNGDTCECAFQPVHARCDLGKICDAKSGCASPPPCATAADCPDIEGACMQESCEAATATCAYTPLDSDGDGHSPQICVSVQGDDCNDADADVYPGAPELCRLNSEDAPTDDDCDGVIDGQADPCGSEVGACVTGTNTCVDGEWSGCEGGVLPTQESCNNEDDDCDGDTDEDVDWDNDGVKGVCAGGDDCDDAQAWVYPGNTEVCDGIDNDCNGLTDECEDDGNPCTEEACTGGLLCASSFANGPCDDDNACTKNDTCVFGECVGESAYWEIIPEQGGGVNAVVGTTEGGEVVAGALEGAAWTAAFTSEAALVWQKQYGNAYVVNDITTAAEGHHAFVGEKEQTQGGTGGWLAVIDSTGTVVWEQLFGATFATDVTATFDGGLLIGGQGSYGTWVRKYDAQGNPLWEEELFSDAWVVDLVAFDDGKSFVLINWEGSDPSDIHTTAVVLNDAGKMIGEPNDFFDSIAYAALAESGGGYILAGVKVYNDYEEPGDPAWLLRSHYTMWWPPVWELTVPGVGFFALAPAIEGDGIVAAGAANGVAMLVRTNDAGAVLWKKQYTYGTEARSIVAHEDGTYTIGGTFNDGVMSRPWLARVDAQGELACAGE